MNSKKLQQIEGWTGLQAIYGGGDYTVTVWQSDNSAHYEEDDYELVFCKSNTDLAHERKHVAAADLEAEMRNWQPDLRRWHKVEYDS